MKASFTVDICVLKALRVFSDRAAIGRIHARAKDGVLLLESTDGAALLRVYPVVEIDGDQTFDVLLPTTGFDVLKAKILNYAPKTATITIPIDRSDLVLTCGGLSSTVPLLDVTAYPATDRIADTEPSFDLVETHNITLKLLTHLTRCLSFLGAQTLNFTAFHGENGMRVSRGTVTGVSYELYFMPAQY
jgi:hypothetical protein